MTQPIINIKSLIDKVIIINADGKSVEEIQQAVETALKNAIKSVQENQESNSDKSFQQSDENNYPHSL